MGCTIRNIKDEKRHAKKFNDFAQGCVQNIIMKNVNIILYLQTNLHILHLSEKIGN